MTKHYDYHSSEESEKGCESKHSCDYKKPSKCPPNVAGTWTRYRVQVIDGRSISNPTTSTETVTMTQNGRFVTFDRQNGRFVETYLGVWQFNPIAGWSLYFVENDTNNHTYILTPIKSKKKLVVLMNGIGYVAGTNRELSPFQVAQVEYTDWVRTSYC